jgi:hypothetical protein
MKEHNARLVKRAGNREKRIEVRRKVGYVVTVISKIPGEVNSRGWSSCSSWFLSANFDASAHRAPATGGGSALPPSTRSRYVR